MIHESKTALGGYEFILYVLEDTDDENAEVYVMVRPIQPYGPQKELTVLQGECEKSHLWHSRQTHA